MSQHFLHYTITSTLEKRAASTIYLAIHDDTPARTVALKLFHTPTFSIPAKRDEFLQETAKLRHLNHPLIVPILDAGIEKEQAYIVSTYMPNGSLRVRLDRAYPQRLASQQAMTIINQIGQALNYLHARYLTHGQIKPEHVLFDANGRALLSDPYTSANLPTWNISNENASDDFRYLAPEQFDGGNSALSDQYALCCLAYELLTGRPPFTLRDPQALEDQQRYAEPTPPRQFVSTISVLTEQAILKGLAKEPAQRHADIATLLEALQHLTTSQTDSNPPLPRSKRRTSSLVPPPPSSQAGRAAPSPARPTPPAQPTSPMKPFIPPVVVASRPASSKLSDSTEQPLASSQPDSELDDTFTEQQPATLELNQEAISLPASDEQAPWSRSGNPASESPYTPPEDFDDFLRDMDFVDDLTSAPLLPASAAQNAAVPEEFDDFLPDTTSVKEPAAPEIKPVTAAQNNTSEPFDKLLQDMKIEEEILFATSSYAALRETTDQDTIDVVPTIALAQLEPAMSNTATPPQSPAFLTTASSQVSSTRPTTIALWSLLLLLMLGGLWTYNALAATSPASSTLTLLSHLPNPTPKATVDPLGILSSTTVSMEKPPATPTPHAKPTPKPTPKSKPKPTPTPKPSITPTTAPIVPIGIPTPTPQPIVPIAPAPTPKPTPKPTPPPAAPLGKIIWLQATINSDYVSTSLGEANAPLYAEASQVQAWEKFRVIDAGNGLIALQSVGNGDYVSVRAYTANAPLQAVATSIDDWEEFQWVSLGNGNIALLSKANGDYVSSWYSTVNAPLYAVTTTISTWETFKWGTTN